MTEELEQKARERTPDYMDMIQRAIYASAYVDGVTENSIQWHKVADGDLPKDDKNCLIITDDGNYYIAKHYNNYNHWVCKVNIYVSFIEHVVAWCEIPQFKE